MDELNDRFGKIPEEIINLIEVAKIKHQCKKLAIERIEAKKDGIVISFKDNKFKNPDKLLEMIFSSNSQIKINSGQKVLFLFNQKTLSSKITASFLVIKKLQEIS